MKYFLLLITLSFPNYCFAQVHLSLSTGHASFAMHDMKMHQSELRKEFPVDVKVFESFPAFWNYELGISADVTQRLRIGGILGYTSTGGQMYYSDYSGKIAIDQLTTAVSLAAYGECIINPDDMFEVSFNWKTGITTSRYYLDMQVVIDQQGDSENFKFRSKNFFVEPGFILSKHLISRISGKFSAGYNINILRSQLSWSEDRDLYLLDKSNEKVKLDWTGYRLSVGLSVDL